MSDKKIKQSFKEYYYGNPEFRERHMKNMNERVMCECGILSSRANLMRHAKSRRHNSRLENPKELDKKQLIEMKKELAKMQKIIERSIK